jgi:ferrous iron transport protein A
MVAVPSSFWTEPVPSVEGEPVPLAALANGCRGTIVSVAQPGQGVDIEVVRRLRELGFLAGEQVRVIARGMGGVEPIAVRIGTATFALRRFEAACIQVQPLRVSSIARPVATGAK